MYVDLLESDLFRLGNSHLSGVPGDEKAIKNPASDNSRRADTAVPWFVLTIWPSKVNVMNVVNVAAKDII